MPHPRPVVARSSRRVGRSSRRVGPRLVVLFAAAVGAGHFSFDVPHAWAGEEREWSWPVRGPVVSSFRYGPDPFLRGQRRGIRIGARLGAPVRSACAGRVRFAGSAGTSGRTVSVACSRLLATYLHLGVIYVRRGESLARGERLGTVGRTGRPRLTFPHLAFGARLLDRRWSYVDPLRLLGEGERPAPPSPLPVPRSRPPQAVPLRAPRAVPRVAPRGKPRPVPVGGPGTVPVGGSRSAPRRVPLREPRPVPLREPLPVPARLPETRPEARPSLPVVAWLGLAALAGALVAVPGQRRRRRRRGTLPSVAHLAREGGGRSAAR